MAALFDLAPLEDRLLGDGVLALLRTLNEFEESADSPLTRRVIAVIAEAVRLDSVLLERCRETLFQCLWNRLWWASSPTSAAWYDVEDGCEPGLLGEPDLAEALQELLHAWGTAKEAQQPGFLWVRSLRPPSTPLGHGLLARTEVTSWSGSPEAIEALHGWCGFIAALPEGPYRLSLRDGIAEIRDIASENRPRVAVYPENRELLAHPSGRIWAHEQTHIALEGGFPPRQKSVLEE